MLLLVCFPLLSGCWDRIEMNDISFFMAAALDLDSDGKLRTTIQIPIPAGAGSGEGGKVSKTGTIGNTYYIVSSRGENIYDAERQTQEKNARHFFKGHRRILFIGESLAQKGIEDVLDNYARDPGSRLRTYLVVAKGGKGMRLLENNHPLERIPSEEVRELERSGIGMAVTIRDFLIMQARGGIVPVTGAVDLKSPIPASDEEKKPDFSLFRLSSTAIFKDYQLKGYLNNVESRNLRWIKGELKGVLLGMKLPQLGGNIGIDLSQTHSRIKVAMDGDKAKVAVKLSGVGVINEYNLDLDLMQPGSISSIERAIGEEISKETIATVQKVQRQWRADVFGFGRVLHQKNLYDWKRVGPEWDRIFSQAEVVVTADIKLQRAGIITNSFQHQGKKVP